MADSLEDVGIEFEDTERAELIADGLEASMEEFRAAMQAAVAELREDPPRQSLHALGELSRTLGQLVEVHRQYKEFTIEAAERQR